MRIVSLVPSITHALHAMGAGDEVVGVTRFCVDPADAKARAEVVGGTKDPDVSKVAALRPDVVLANNEENRAEDLAAIRAAGLRVETLDPVAVEDVSSVLRTMGRLVGRADEADALADGVRDAIDEAVDATLGWKRVRVFVPVWRKPLMSVNGNTYVSSLVAACGGVNVFSHLERRYPVVERDHVVSATPQAILLPTEPFRFKGEHIPEFEGLGAPRDRIEVADGRLLTWWGALTPKAIRHFVAVMARMRRSIADEVRPAPPGERDADALRTRVSVDERGRRGR